MKLFGQIVRTVVNVAVLPVTAAVDAVALIADAADGEVAPRTREQLKKIKD
jgi:hypothetical protein